MGKINIEATKEKFRESGRKFQAYATAKGYNPSHWQQKMAGNVHFTEAELDTMRKDGLLVEYDEIKKSANKPIKSPVRIVAEKSENKTIGSIELLQNKFKETKYKTVASWMRDNNVNLSLQSCTTVLHRGDSKGLVVMLTLASALNCTPEEMQRIAEEQGDKTLWRLITNETITKEESQLLDSYRTLFPEQKKIILSILKEMRPKS